MPGDTPLGKAAKKFVAQKESIADSKLKLEEIEGDILKIMADDGVHHFKVMVGGENYEFDLVESKKAIRCAKITKTIKPIPGTKSKQVDED